MHSRLATAKDLAGILALQSDNLYQNLTPQQRTNGFVTTPFDELQLQQLVQSNGLFVLEVENEVQGYAMGEGWPYFSQWPIFPFMLERLSGQEFAGIRISETNSFQYGPVCIAQSLRGTNAFPHIFEAMRLELNQRFPIGITFINQINQRSFHAHIRRLSMKVVDEFTFNQQQYYGLAFDTSKSVLW